MDRRDFLKSAALAGAATMMPRWVSFAASRPELIAKAADLTTLNQTIVKGAAISEGVRAKYHRLAWGPGEPHILREDLAKSRNGHNRNVQAKTPLLNIAHFTDIHIIDAQSPARVEFLDRYADPGNGCESIPFSSAHRPQEVASLHILEAMVRRLREVQVSPLTGTKIQSVVCTGDNIDNEQLNELRWFIDTMDGGKKVSSNSGATDKYEGVQSAEWADAEYWHPDEGVTDKYKQLYGFPEYPGLLDDVILPFSATGVGIPWYQTFGNHDGLLQGNAPRNAVFEGIAVGPAKIVGLPPGVNPCDSFDTLRNNPTAFLSAPMHPTTADGQRKIVTRAEYIDEMFNTTGSPKGHGLTQRNKEDGTAYWHSDEHPGFRFIGLDTVNPGGFSEGSIGAAQLAWLEERLKEVSSRYYDAAGEEVTQDADDRLVILFSHHGLRSLDNPVATPDPAEPSSNDLPRMTSEEIEAVVQRYPNVIAWVNGHTHENIVDPRKGPHGGFWDIGTAAHIDWSCQSRLVEVLDNRDGTLSIFCTMIDHAAPAVPGAESDRVLRLASISRELAANDYQAGFNSAGPGKPEDRNVELVIDAPFPTQRLTKRARQKTAARA
ncbi:MAG: TIGR03767 family metallophosphoesterase [Actinomycetota bacterium]